MTTFSSGRSICLERVGSIRRGRIAISITARTTRACTLRGRTRTHTRHGRENACRRRPSGSGPPEAAWRDNPLFGEVNSCPQDDFRRIRSKGIFPVRIHRRTDLRQLLRCDHFLQIGFGLYDVAGNVWEWCLDWYEPSEFKDRGAVTVNPYGPAVSFDPGEPGVPKRVMKGGSFLCTNQYCSRYMPGGRGKGEPSTGSIHVGFRCVSDPSVAAP